MLFQTKLKSQEKKVDFFERAKRIEEIPLLEKHLAEKQVKNRELWNQQEEERIAQLMEERKIAMLHRDRLMRMSDDKVKFVEKLKADRLEVFTRKLTEFNSKYDKVRSERLKERKDKRREQRRIQWTNGIDFFHYLAHFRIDLSVFLSIFTNCISVCILEIKI